MRAQAGELKGEDFAGMSSQSRNAEVIQLACGHKFSGKNLNLLEKALAANDFQADKRENSPERLRLNGSSLLGFVITDKICRTLPPSQRGDLIDRVMKVVEANHIAKSLQLNDKFYAALGTSEVWDVSRKFHRILGAVLADAGCQKAFDVCKALLPESFYDLEDIVPDERKGIIAPEASLRPEHQEKLNELLNYRFANPALADGSIFNNNVQNGEQLCHDARYSILGNGVLILGASLAVNGLMCYGIHSGFQPLKECRNALSRMEGKWRSPHLDTLTEIYSEITSKVKCNRQAEILMKSLIGAVYLDGGLDSALLTVKWLFPQHRDIKFD